MAKKWAEVADSPAYQALPPEKQEAARNQYFDQIVSPQVPEDKRQIAKQQFDQSTSRSKPANLNQEVTKTADTVKSVVSKAGGRDSSADYETGAPFSIRSEFYTADNDAERRKVLQKAYPEGKVAQDPAGNWMITNNGKTFSVEGSHPFSNFGGKMLAKSGEIGGSVAGGVGGGALAGAEIGALGGPVDALTVPLGAMIGAGVGAMGGGGLQDIMKRIKGTEAQNPKELASNLASTGSTNAMLESAGPILSGAGKSIASGARAGMNKVLGVTPEIKELAKSTAAAGARPGMSSIAPEGKTLQFKEALSKKVVGSFKDNPNLQAMGKLVSNFLEKQGVPDAPAAAAKVVLKDVAEDGRPVGAAVTKVVQDYHKGLQETAKKEMQNANSILDDNLKTIQKSFGKSAEKELGMSQAEAISAARSQFSKVTSKMYKMVDQLTGGKPIIPSDSIKRSAQGLIKAMPKNADGSAIFTDPKLMKIIADLGKLPDKIKFSDAQNIKSALGELALNKDLTPGLPQRQFSLLRDSLNRAIDASAADPAAAPAVKLLRATDKFYADGIKKFENQAANDLIQAAKNKTIPDPKKVTEMIIKPGNKAQAEQYKQIVGEKAWRRVAEQDLKNIISASTDMEGNISSKNFAKLIKDRGPMMETIYGKKTADEIKQYATRLAMKDGKLPTRGVTPDNFVKSLQAAEKATDALNDVKATNFLSKLSKPGFERDQAFDFLVSPGKSERLERVVKFFGNNPEIQTGLQQTFLKKALSAGFTPGEKLEKEAINGNDIIGYINSFTPSQRKILMPDTTEGDLRYLAKEINFLFPKKSANEMAAGLAAGQIKGGTSILRPLSYLPVGYKALTGWILANPKVIKFIAEGSKAPEAQKSIYRNALEKSLKTYLATEANTGQRNFGLKEQKPAKQFPLDMQVPEESEPGYGGPQ